MGRTDASELRSIGKIKYFRVIIYQFEPTSIQAQGSISRPFLKPLNGFLPTRNRQRWITA
jgi:hypothetical protein